MSFAVLRAAKLGASGVGAATHHHEKRLDLPNVDIELSQFNRSLIGSGNVAEDVQKRLDQIGIRPRKNACRAVEFIVTASPEFYRFQKVDDPTKPGQKTLKGNVLSMTQFHAAALEWFTKTYGKENVVTANLHMDEKTPHMHVFVVPITKKQINLTRQRQGKPQKPARTQLKTVLSATDVMGGPKQLAELQTSFATAVAHLGLRRGIAGTGAKHTTTKQYATLTAAAVKGENTKMVEQTLALLGNRRDRIEQSELQLMKKALNESGLVLYKGRIMSISDAQKAQEVEKLVRATRREENRFKELKTAPKQEPTPNKATRNIKPRR